MDYNKQNILLFFERHMDVYPLYESFEAILLREFPQTQVKLQKSQISFYNRHMFACVSFLRPKRKAELPPSYFILTLGMPYPLESPRAAVKAEPYPGRWITHIVISSPDDLDLELFDWLREAYEFSEYK